MSEPGMQGIPKGGDTGLRRIRQVLLLFSTLVVVLVASVIAFEVVSDRNRVIADTSDDVENLRDALVEHTRQTFAALDVALLSIASDIDTTALADARTHRELAARQGGMPATCALFVVDDRGLLVSTSRTAAPEPVDFSDRTSFARHRDDPAAGLFLAAPRKGMIGYAEDRWIVNVSRRLSHPDGRFAGYVAAALSLDHLGRFYEALRVGSEGVVGLVRDDGTILTRTPVEDRYFGRSLTDTRLFQELLPAAASGVYRARFVTDGIDRVTAYGRVPGLPVVVYVGISVDERLTPWRRRAAIDTAIAVLAGMLVLGLSLLTLRRLDERQRETAARIAQLARLNAAATSLMRCRTLHEALERSTILARELVPCHQAVASLTTGPDFAQSIQAVQLSDRYAGWRGYEEAPSGRGIYRIVCEPNRPMRLTQAELEAHPAWRGFGEARDRHPPMRGWLAAPVTRDDGGSLGLIQLSDRESGEFTAEDEALLVELARIAGDAVQRLQSDDARRAALAESEAARREIEEIFASITDAVYAFDPDWRFIYLNDRAEKLLQRSRRDLLGRVLWEAFPDVVGSKLEAEYRRCREECSASEFEFYYPPLDTWFNIRVFVRDETLTVYFRDVSDVVRKEEQLRQAQKLEAVGQLTGGVAHDFNNLLTVILGNAEYLEEGLSNSDELRALAEVIRVSAERGAELTHRLLAFARKQALDPKPANVNRLVAGMDGLLRRSLGEHVEIELVRGAGLWQAQVDAPQLENALLNLCINGRDAMPDGGRLTIETANAHLDETYAALHSEVARGQYVMIAVSDTGIGMAPDVAERAFEPFFTTKEVGKGSGLGLSMVYGFIKQSKGHVNIYSEPGQGTTVRMYLPRALQPGVDAEPTVDRAVAGGTERILVVEDDDLVRAHVTRQLESFGYVVVAVGDGRRALEVLDEGGTFDLLFTDVVMPGGLSGRQLAEEVRRLRPHMPVLFTSGYTENAIVHHGRLDAGVQLLNKPYRRADLAAKVRDMLRLSRERPA